MPKNITQYDLLISCPSDIREEIDIINEVVNKFNSEFSSTLGITVQTRHWKKDSYPSAGDSPQKILNKQFVYACDAVVAIFWTRFGTPTDDYDSGSEEEIEKMIADGKQVFLYFSSRPVSPDAVEHEQYEKVKKFKEKFSANGVYDVYNSIESFRDLFYAHLTRYFLTLSKVEEIKSAKKPDLRLDIIDADTGNQADEKYYYKFPSGLITYKELSEEEIFGEISSYVTSEDIKEYNEALPSEDEVEDFNKKQRLYENSVNNCHDFKISLSNVGNAKANEIYVDLIFPPEILVYYKDDVKLIKEPKDRPKMPVNPINKAMNEIEKKRMRALLGRLDPYTQADEFFNSINGARAYIESPVSVLSPFEILPSRTYDYYIEDNSVLTLHEENLLHTREIKSKEFSLIFTSCGEFEVKYSIMCEEWEEETEGTVRFKVERG